MTVRLATATRNAMVTAWLDLLDAGSGAGKIRIYSGSQPASAQDSATGTLLAEITLNDPAFSKFGGVGTIDSDPALTDTVDSTGTAGWFRALDSDNNTVFDGAITATGGGGDLTLASTSLVAGGTVTITGGTCTQPAG